MSLNDFKKISPTKSEYKIVLQLLAPFAPHVTEELWHQLGHTTSIHLESWPIFDKHINESESAIISIQVDGKMRGTISVNKSDTQEEILKLAMSSDKIAKFLDAKKIKKVIHVPSRVLSIVTGDN